MKELFYRLIFWRGKIMDNERIAYLLQELIIELDKAGILLPPTIL